MFGTKHRVAYWFEHTTIDLKAGCKRSHARQTSIPNAGTTKKWRHLENWELYGSRFDEVHSETYRTEFREFSNNYQGKLQIKEFWIPLDAPAAYDFMFK